jgi:SAM-dependent methyltransferase
MTDFEEKWSEETSGIYRQLAQVAVPAREEQIAALLMLLPFRTDESFRAVELASGEGRLSYAILHSFRQATLLALDYEQSMRDETSRRLSEFGARARVAAFDMVREDWYPQIEGADCVVSSLCVHHLTGEEKQALFKAIAARLAPRGVLLIADLIATQRAEANRLFAATWDASAESQSLAQVGSRALYDKFVETHWNYYHHPDPFDKPSPLFEQLVWLKEAGFALVDCFWMQAGHAIYGGYQSQESSAADLDYKEALSTARQVLKMR